MVNQDYIKATVEGGTGDWDDKQIKRMLKDASLWLNDASKRWSRHKDTAYVRFMTALSIIEELQPIFDEYGSYVERPMGGEEGEDA